MTYQVLADALAMAFLADESAFEGDHSMRRTRR